MGSQVIVNGEVYDNLSAQEYYKMKDNLAPEVMKAFNHLSEENDIIVIEGAGSPAEINLAENDIVNMGMARIAHSPVLIVGDIDRGGNFREFVPYHYSKATGIQFLLDHFALSGENAYAFGDSNNDLPMLLYVPHSVAMGNATPETLFEQVS